MLTLIHGGQTGVDRGAHDAAIDNGWAVAGYMPRDGRDERGPIPPDVAQSLWTCEKPGFAARTEANVRTSDALLVVVQNAADPQVTPGTAKTLNLATGRNLRRQIVDSRSSSLMIAEWIWRDLLAHHMQMPMLFEMFETSTPDPIPVRLMVAGPRESKWPGAQAETAGFLRRVGHELRKMADAPGLRRTA